VSEMPGAGGGGGFGGGAAAFFRAVLRPGIEVIFEHTDFEKEVRRADVVITGEGKLDQQTLSGKVVAGVSRLARHYGKPVIGVSGASELSPDDLSALNLKTVFTIVDAAGTDDPFQKASAILERIAAQRIAPLLADMHSYTPSVARYGPFSLSRERSRLMIIVMFPY